MSDNKELKIVITGDASGAQKAAGDTGKAFDELGGKVEKLGAKQEALAKLPEPLQKLHGAFDGLRDLPGQLGQKFGGLADNLLELPAAGEAASVGIGGGMATATLAVAGVAAAIAGIVVGLVKVAEFANDAFNKRMDLANTIDGIQDLTGMTAEYTSVLTTVGEVAGVSSDAIMQMASSNARAMREANEQMEKISNRKAELQTEAAAKEQDLEKQHAERMTELARAADERLADIKQDQQRRDDAYRRDAEADEKQLNDRLADINTGRIDKIQQAERSAADAIKRLNADLDKERQAFTEKQADIQKKVDDEVARGRERLAQQEASHADRLRSIDQQIGDAKLDETDRQELAVVRSKREIERLERESADKRIALEAELAQAIDDKAREAIQKKIAALGVELEATKKKNADDLAESQKQADEDLALKVKQLERRKTQENEENERRLTAIRDQNAKELLEAQAKQVQELADLRNQNAAKLAEIQARIKQEQDDLAAQTAEIKGEADKRAADLKASYDQSRANAKRAYDQQATDNKAAQDKITADVARRVDAEIGSYDKATKAVTDNLAKQLRAADESMPPIVRAVEDLGLKWDDINKMEPDKRMQAILDKLGHMPDSANKAAIEMSLFGKAGKDVNDIAEIFANSTLKDLTEKTERWGRLMGEDTVEKMVKAKRGTQETRLELESLTQAVGEGTEDAFIDFNAALKDFAVTYGPNARDIAKDVAWAISEILHALTDLLKITSGKKSLWEVFFPGMESGQASLPSPSTASGPLGWLQSLFNSAYQVGWNYESSLSGTPITPTTGNTSSTGAIPGGTAITAPTTNVYTINVQNPITNNTDIPAMQSYLQRTYGSGG